MMSRCVISCVLTALPCMCRSNLLAQPPAAPVEVAPIIQKEVAAGATFIGTSVPRRTSIVGSAVAGRVLDFLVDEGDAVGMITEGEVAQGQPLAQLRTKTISIEVEAAKAELELRRQELAELVNGARPEEIAEAKAALAGAKALRDYRLARYRRVETLNRGNASSQEELEEALSAHVAAEQNYLRAQATRDLVVNGPREEEIAQARARVAVQTEVVNRLEDMKAKYTIRAPFEGYVVARHTEVGAWVTQGDAVAEVVQLDPIEITVSIPEAYVSYLRRGAEVRVLIDALPEEVFIGEIWRVIPQADLRSRSFPVKIRLENPRKEEGHLVKAGMLARATLAVGAKTQALLVPKDALVLNRGTTNVIVVGKDMKSRPVDVRLGVVTGSLVQILDRTDSIKAGDRVVVRGNERLRPGTPVEIVRELKPE